MTIEEIYELLLKDKERGVKEVSIDTAINIAEFAVQCNKNLSETMEALHKINSKLYELESINERQKSFLTL